MNMINDTKVNDTMGANCVELKHNDLIILNGRKGSVGTVLGCSIEWHDDIIASIKRSLDRKEDMYWINQEATCICADKGYYEAQEEKWSKAINLVDGQIVKIEGATLKVHYKGNYSDMANFIKI